MHYTPKTTLDDIRARGTRRVWVAHSTVYWTDKPLYRHPKTGEYCDPRGSVLEELDQHDFLRLAEVDPEHFGKHGLRAFEAAYHGNILTAEERPTSVTSWDEVNRLIDAYLLQALSENAIEVEAIQ